jgi:AbrB family looped-hinge helix DNA binding protein
MPINQQHKYTRTVEKNGRLMIPPEVLNGAGMKAGDLVEFTAMPGMITLRKISTPK